MVRYEFEVPGEPVGKGRPRFGNGRTYTPAKTANYENLVRVAFAQTYPDAVPLDGPIDLIIRAYFSVPKSFSKKKRQDALNDDIAKTTRPDIDNIVKVICDGLNEVAWKDDAQIFQLDAWKGFGLQPKVEITIMSY